VKLRRYRPGEDDPVAIYKAFLAGQIPMIYLGMWRDETAARAVLEYAWQTHGIAAEEVPRVCRLPWFYEQRLSGLIRHYRNSPYLLLTTLYPSRWDPLEFAKVPFADDLKKEALSAEGIPTGETALRRRYLVNRVRLAKQKCCWLCRRPLPTGSRSRMCPECRDRIAAWTRGERRRRREAGMCTIIGCPNRAAPGRVRCEKHTVM
jgi:hypothetical protein